MSRRKKQIDKNATQDKSRPTPVVGGGDGASLPRMVLETLPHAILLLDRERRITFANPSAEQLFSFSEVVLRRLRLDDLVTFGCPLIGLVEQVMANAITVNEYGVEVVLPRSEDTLLVDVFGGALRDDPELTLLLLQQRSMAQMIERQLNHRAAARSASGFSSVLAHEIKNPLSGIRGASAVAGAKSGR